MVDLFCTPFVDLVDRMRLEYRNQQSMFDLPARKWYLPADDPLAPDLSVRLHDKVAGTPVGPASGPQTQMAQNLVLSWLAGGRLMELKTVQVNDRLTIPRPCIDAANVGYNVEWSQELSVPDSLDQYVQGAMLIHMLRHAPEVFGNPFGRGISHRQQPTLGLGKDPAAVGKADFHLAVGLADPNCGVFRRQQHPVVEFAEDAPQQVFQRDEIDHTLDAVERAFHLGADPKVVAVQRFAGAVGQGDEVAGTELQPVAGDLHAVCFHSLFRGRQNAPACCFPLRTGR